MFLNENVRSFVSIGYLLSEYTWPACVNKELWWWQWWWRRQQWWWWWWVYVVYFLLHEKMYLVSRIPLPVSTLTYFHLIFVSLSLNMESMNSSRLAVQWAVGICQSLCSIHSPQQTHTLICYKCVLLCLEFTSVLESQTYIPMLSQ